MSDQSGFYRSICHIFCGEECGNGYLVAPDLVLTADHVVRPFFEDGIKVDVRFECEDSITCEVLSSPKYSLQGTTQGRYLTGGVPPVRFSM